MDKDILFDNIYIGHSVEDAAKFAQETFHEKHPIEQLLELEDKPKVFFPISYIDISSNIN
jgi:calnexin